MKIYKLEEYFTIRGRSPFHQWLIQQEKVVQYKVIRRLDLLTEGHFGDCKKLSSVSMIWELRIKSGSGYRVYFARYGQVIILLLTAGNKKTQKRDIAQAERYLMEYLERN